MDIQSPDKFNRVNYCKQNTINNGCDPITFKPITFGHHDRFLRESNITNNGNGNGNHYDRIYSIGGGTQLSANLNNDNNYANEIDESFNSTIINDQGDFLTTTITPPPPPTIKKIFLHQNRSKPVASVQNQRNNRKLSDQYFLWIITSVAASISLAVIIAALAGPYWLYIEEKLPNSDFNNTINLNKQDNDAFIIKYTKSSLWILCSSFQGIDSYHCIKIDYFPKEEHRSDHHDSTLAIPHTVVRSTPFFIVSGIFLLIGFSIFLFAVCTRQNSLYYFTSGILFIVAGLLMFIGLIVYISVFKAEIGSKLHSKSTHQPPLLKYYYGQSFFLYVFGFISTEFVGVLNIFLFISLQQIEHHKNFPCFAFTNIQGNVSQNMVDNKQQNNNNRTGICNKKDENNPINKFMCRKHSMPSNYFFEYRHNFDKPEKCEIHYHSQNLAKSLNELYMIDNKQQPQYRQKQQTLSNMQLGYPLTRSVSTSTGIFSTSKYSNTFNDDTLSRKHIKKQQTLNVSKDRNLNDICGLSSATISILKKPDTINNNNSNNNNNSSICNKKSKRNNLFYEFCKMTGIRKKSKNIYYIENDNENDDENIFIIDNNNTNDDYDYNNDDNIDSLLITNRSNRNSFHYEIQPPSSTSPLPFRASQQVTQSLLGNKNKSLLSLHNYNQNDKIYNSKVNNIFDMKNSYNNGNGGGGGGGGGSQEFWNMNDNRYFTKNLDDNNYNIELYQSRTLPRCFLKRNFDLSYNNGIDNVIENDYYQTHEFNKHRRWNANSVSNSKDNLRGLFHKSFDDINLMKMTTINGTRISTLPPIVNNSILQKQKSNNNNLSIQWPTTIPTSPSYSIKSAFHYVNHNNNNNNNNNNSNSNSNNNNNNNNNNNFNPSNNSNDVVIRSINNDCKTIPKFTRGYAFDDRRSVLSNVSGVFESFNLDEIEKERQKSHASLLGLGITKSTSNCNKDDNGYDLFNGTEV